MYVFDTNSFSKLFGCYPIDSFPSLWRRFDSLSSVGGILSTREVLLELEAGKRRTENAYNWAKENRELFTPLIGDEAAAVAEIFRVEHFQQIMRRKEGVVNTSADPFIIARASFRNGTVVTEESKPPHGARIPNICERFNIPCIKLNGFMQQENWTF
ncbi:MAG: DUF4411 family protein [Chloroflexi bacterium]|nr:DUF4411 family protein [Chloroflexota bacterium]